MAINRKHGRHKTRSPSAKCYTAEGRREKNKLKNIAVHSKQHPNDKQKPGVIPNYKLIKLELKKQIQVNRDVRWKNYLKEA